MKKVLVVILLTITILLLGCVQQATPLPSPDNNHPSIKTTPHPSVPFFPKDCDENDELKPIMAFSSDSYAYSSPANERDDGFSTECVVDQNVCRFSYRTNPADRSKGFELSFETALTYNSLPSGPPKGPHLFNNETYRDRPHHMADGVTLAVNAGGEFPEHTFIPIQHICEERKGTVRVGNTFTVVPYLWTACKPNGVYDSPAPHTGEYTVLPCVINLIPSKTGQPRVFDGNFSCELEALDWPHILAEGKDVGFENKIIKGHVTGSFYNVCFSLKKRFETNN